MRYEWLSPLAVAAILLACGGARAELRPSVSQYGITWTFDRPAECGRFITGDWRVVGPVTVTAVTPAPGPADPGQKVEAPRNQFGDAAHQDDGRMRNGMMIVGEITHRQGYDSRGQDYDAALSLSVPCRLEPGRSLISTISHEALPNPSLTEKLIWPSEQKVRAVLKTAAILTCLGEAPPADAFRPSYAGTDRRLYRYGDLRWERLGRLKRPDGPVKPQFPWQATPTWEEMERYFQRPWIDHSRNWIFCHVMPTENQAAYGREYARLVSLASVMLQLDEPQERKRKTLIGLVQLGIDLHGLVELGMRWTADGGIWSGRKWPILFAGILLDDPAMANLPPEIPFHEDQQTYYGAGWAGQTALFQMVAHHGPRRPYEERSPEQWDAMDRRSEAYRRTCNAQAWIGSVLAARLMGAQRAWGHDALFDYCQRWMMQDDPFAAARGDHPRPEEEGATYDPLVSNMYFAYWDQAPRQDGAEKNLKWVWDTDARGRTEGKWVANPR
ncbi:MAG: hypothetical protein GX591_05605 [Planctomycetes bacterium]|nr:hypothetical protein [Planctomycetota bacterium]